MIHALPLVTVPLTDVLEELGFVEEKNEAKITNILNYYEEEAEGIPDEAEGVISYLSDEDLLKDALDDSEVDKEKFFAILEKISKENNDLPVVVVI